MAGKGKIYLNGVDYSGSIVVGNPTVPNDVTPTALSNLQIDDDYYTVSGGGGGGGSDIYSTTEQVVGTWIDGRPLYQKTYYIASHSGGNQVIDNTLTVSDVDYIATTETSFTGGGNSFIDTTTLSLQIALTSQGLMLDTNHCLSTSMSNIYITVRYTKVADI